MKYKEVTDHAKKKKSVIVYTSSVCSHTVILSLWKQGTTPSPKLQTRNKLLLTFLVNH